jgi:hypothetical protein
MNSLANITIEAKACTLLWGKNDIKTVMKPGIVVYCKEKTTYRHFCLEV